MGILERRGEGMASEKTRQQIFRQQRPDLRLTTESTEGTEGKRRGEAEEREWKIGDTSAEARRGGYLTMLHPAAPVALGASP